MADLNYPSQIQMALDPSLGSENWSWWRRKVKLPTQKARVRLEVIRVLESSIDFIRRLPPPIWPKIGGQEIFGSSVCRLEMLDSRRGPKNLQVPGWVYRGNSTSKHLSACPFGRLTLSAQQSEFSFDAREIDGMWASKSSECHFSTIREFGAGYATYMKATHDDAGAIEVGPWFDDALSRQVRNRAALAERFGARVNGEIFQLGGLAI